MTDVSDRRIQLRESVHQVVTRAANARGVTPAAFVSMVIYEYLRDRGELDGIQSATTTPPVGAKTITSVTQPDPVPLRATISHEDVAAAWADYDDDEDDTPRIDLSKMRPTPVLDVDAAMSDLEDDEEDWRESS